MCYDVACVLKPEECNDCFYFQRLHIIMHNAGKLFDIEQRQNGFGFVSEISYVR